MVKKSQLWTSNVLFVTLVHLVALAAPLIAPINVKTIILCGVIWQLAGLSIHSKRGSRLKRYNISYVGVTVGYHRLWSHRTFEAALPVRVVLAWLGTIAFQGSIKWWVIRHRLHHRYIL